MMATPIDVVHTLGPTGTNCEAAAREWGRRKMRNVSVLLHPTLESAVVESVRNPSSALLACIVYPELHSLVFSNLDRLELVECFVMPTHRMVLATHKKDRPTIIASHPAPRRLVDLAGFGDASVEFVNSNVAAADMCAAGGAEACVTTHVAAESRGLRVLRDFGPIQMGFSIHAARAQ